MPKGGCMDRKKKDVQKHAGRGSDKPIQTDSARGNAVLTQNRHIEKRCMSMLKALEDIGDNVIEEWIRFGEAILKVYSEKRKPVHLKIVKKR
jgi:hypothetical protein